MEWRELEVSIFFNVTDWGTSLMGQWLKFCTPNAGGLGLTPGQGTRSHMPYQRVSMPELKISLAKSWHSQINTYFKKERTGNVLSLCVD